MSGLAVDLPLETERLVLRAHRREDLDDLVRFHGDPEVVRYVPWPVRDRAATNSATTPRPSGAAIGSVTAKRCCWS